MAPKINLILLLVACSAGCACARLGEHGGGARQLGAATSPPPKMCKEWCHDHPDPWTGKSGKCSWDTNACSACPACKPPPKMCKEWCHDHPDPWTGKWGKCSWDTNACSACPACKQEQPVQEVASLSASARPFPDDFYCLPGRKSATPSPCRFYTPAETDAVVAAAGPRCVDNAGTFTITNDDGDGTEQHVTCAMAKAHGSCNIQPFKNKASESILQWTLLLNCPKLCAGTEYEIAPWQSPDPHLVYMLDKLGTVSGNTFTADSCAPTPEEEALERVKEAARAAEESRRAAMAQAMRQMQEMQRQMQELQKAMKLFG